MGNASAVNITAANTTGVALKLDTGPNINVGFTKRGTTEVGGTTDKLIVNVEKTLKAVSFYW